MSERRVAVVTAFVVVACLLLCALLVLVVATGYAHAASYLPLRDQDLRRGAAAVVVADVEAVVAGTHHHEVTLRITQALKGGQRLVGVRLILVEPGGTEWIVPGVAPYEAGTEAVVALTRGRGGRLRTYQHALGQWTVRRGYLWDDAVQRGERRWLRTLMQALRDDLQIEPLALTPEDDLVSVAEPFRLFNNVRWFEPDAGVPVRYRLDQGGDAVIGLVASERAVRGALAAWTAVPTASLVAEVGAVGPVTRGGCDGQTTITWNDPYGEIDPPANCGGVLALGGYCASGETRVVNGTTFRRITEGDIVFADGWGPCGFWIEPNVAEIATHELGHTIGLAHSDVKGATMEAYAHFDGRGASLMPDDATGVAFIYPATEPIPTATWTPARTVTPTPTLPPMFPWATPTVTASEYVPWTTPTVTPVPLLVRTDRDMYRPGDRVRIIVQSAPRTSVRVELSHDGVDGPIWVRTGTTGSVTGTRRWWYALPYTATFPLRYTVTARTGWQSAIATFVVVAP